MLNRDIQLVLFLVGAQRVRAMRDFQNAARRNIALPILGKYFHHISNVVLDLKISPFLGSM